MFGLESALSCRPFRNYGTFKETLKNPQATEVINEVTTEEIVDCRFLQIYEGALSS